MKKTNSWLLSLLMVLFMGVVFSSCGNDDEEEIPDTIVVISPEEIVDGVLSSFKGNNPIWMFDYGYKTQDNKVDPQKCLTGQVPNENGEYVFNLKNFDVFDDASHANALFYMLDDDNNVIGFTVCFVEKGGKQNLGMVVNRNKSK